MINCVCSPDDKVANDEHKHVCPRCGTCWKHKEDEAQTSCAAFDEAHSCPSCGKTNVTSKLMDEQQRAKQLAAFERLFGLLEQGKC